MSPTPDSPAAPLESLARLPDAGDNAAVALRDLEAGQRWAWRNRTYALCSDVPAGHRSAVVPITTGSALLSWGLPFGTALRDVAPGEYLCNAVLRELSLRSAGPDLPAAANFWDWPLDRQPDLSGHTAGNQIARRTDPGQLMGYARSGGRGAGTRNHAVILGTSSRTGSLARLVATRLRDRAASWPNLDGIVLVAHTEGADDGG